MTLIEELRSKPSRDNRDLLDRAADAIDNLNIQHGFPQFRIDELKNAEEAAI